jgi:DNA-binding NarL/FixJ family response regulator
MKAVADPSVSTQPADATAAPPPRRILLVDDHPAFRRGLAALLEGEGDLQVCGEASTAPAALTAMRQLSPDLAIVDIGLPGVDGLELIKMMLAERPRLGILVLSMHDESVYALRALRAGARGYVMKAEALECVLVALRKVDAGGLYLSPALNTRLIFKFVQGEEFAHATPVDRLSDREMEVLLLIGKGFGTQEIADHLQVSVKTVETHRAHIKEKLGFRDSRELIRFAVDWNTREEES